MTDRNTKAIVVSLEERHNQVVRMVEALYANAKTEAEWNAVTAVYESFSELVAQAKHQDEIIQIMIRRESALESKINDLTTRLEESRALYDSAFDEGMEAGEENALYGYNDMLADAESEAYHEGFSAGVEDAEVEAREKLAALQAELHELKAALAQWQDYYARGA